MAGFKAGLSLRQSIQEGSVNISYKYKHKGSIVPSGWIGTCDTWCFSSDGVHMCCCNWPDIDCGHTADGDCRCYGG